VSVYPKASAPVTPATLDAANERAERWRVRCEQARRNAALARAETLEECAAQARDVGGMYAPNQRAHKGACGFLAATFDAAAREVRESL
jgi:hypothetical protein